MIKKLFLKLFGNETSWGIIPGFFHRIERKWHYAHMKNPTIYEIKNKLKRFIKNK